jgi:hypothetical protein
MNITINSIFIWNMLHPSFYLEVINDYSYIHSQSQFHNQFFFLNQVNPSTKLILLLTIINVWGLPLCTFFLHKWYRIFIFTSSITSNIVICFILFRSHTIMYIHVNILINTYASYSLNVKILTYLHTYINKNIIFWTLGNFSQSIITLIY